MLRIAQISIGIQICIVVHAPYRGGLAALQQQAANRLFKRQNNAGQG